MAFFSSSRAPHNTKNPYWGCCVCKHSALGKLSDRAQSAQSLYRGAIQKLQECFGDAHAHVSKRAFFLTSSTLVWRPPNTSRGGPCLWAHPKSSSVQVDGASQENCNPAKVPMCWHMLSKTSIAPLKDSALAPMALDSKGQTCTAGIACSQAYCVNVMTSPR